MATDTKVIKNSKLGNFLQIPLKIWMNKIQGIFTNKANKQKTLTMSINKIAMIFNAFARKKF